MQKIILCLILLVLMPMTSLGEEYERYTGNALFNGIDRFLNMTEEEADIESLMEATRAIGYVSGSWEMGLLQYGRHKDSEKVLYCPPVDTAVPNSRLLRIIYDFLTMNPEHLHKGANSLTTMAFIQAFPCP